MDRGHLGVPRPSSSSVMSAPDQSQPTKPSRRRTPKTCGECRRLKLKCDRVFPCQSCIKRGCEGICPEGSLVSGRGSRYILANTGQLHEKIVRMSERIRDLEDALRGISEEHSRCLNLDIPTSGPAHPLLREDLLLIKNQLELYGPDRSQLTPRSDVAYVSDGSDGEQSRLSSEQSLSPSPLDALALHPTAQFLETQLAQYASAHTMQPSSQFTPSVLNARGSWPTNSHNTSPYQPHLWTTNSSAHAPYSAIASEISLGNYQPRHYQTAGSSLPTQNLMDANAAYCSNATRYLSSQASFPRNDAGTVNALNNMWDLESL